VQIVLFESDIRAMPQELRDALLNYLLQGKAVSLLTRVNPREAALIEGLAVLQRPQAIELVREASFRPEGKALLSILRAFGRGKKVLGPGYDELAKSVGARNKRMLDRHLNTLNQLVQTATGTKAGRLWRHSASERAYRAHPATRQVLREVLEQLSRAGEHEEPLWE
jgi:hypothetical protein